MPRRSNKEEETMFMLLPILVILFSLSLAPTPSHAGCVVLSAAGTYADRTFLGEDICDTAGNRIVSLNTLFSGENQTSAQATSWLGVRPRAWATYMASGTFTPAATPTDIVTIAGSASKTIRVHSIRLTTTNTAAGSQQFSLIKRSTADTTGTFVAATAVPTDSGYAAATATVGHYTANPGALGTAVGTINTVRWASSAAVPASFAGVNEDAGQELIPTVRNGFLLPPITLRGTAENLAVNFGGAALVAGQTHAYTVVWSEMNTTEE
jgi:hypothetical protein